MHNALGRNMYNYPRNPHLIVDVTRGADGCGGCSKDAMQPAMNSDEPAQSSWRTADGSAWWLRDDKFVEPNGAYSANCYLVVYGVEPDDIKFNDIHCAIHSKDYLCQPVARTSII